jgi:hypothetical protein
MDGIDAWYCDVELTSQVLEMAAGRAIRDLQ